MLALSLFATSLRQQYTKGYLSSRENLLTRWKCFENDPSSSSVREFVNKQRESDNNESEPYEETKVDFIRYAVEEER